MKTLLFLLSLLFPVSLATAGAITLQFDTYDKVAEGASGFLLRQRLGDGPWEERFTFQTEEVKIENLKAGTYTFQVAAVAAAGAGAIVSDWSNELVATIKPAAPKNLRVKIALMSSDDGDHWQAEGEPVFFTVPSTLRRKFYKGEIAYTDAD